MKEEIMKGIDPKTKESFINKSSFIQDDMQAYLFNGLLDNARVDNDMFKD